MSDDLVKRLRRSDFTIASDAADCIEQLERELNEAREMIAAAKAHGDQGFAQAQEWLAKVVKALAQNETLRATLDDLYRRAMDDMQIKRTSLRAPEVVEVIRKALQEPQK